MLVLGLDAADSILIEKWSDEGILPTFSFLRANGAWIRLTHDQPIPSASIWPSLYTGTYPGKHGIYNGLQIEPGKQQVDVLKPHQCGQPPVWQTLDDHGKLSIVIDVPFTYPLAHFGGIQIVDWGSYERHYRSHSLPDQILREISQRFGGYPFGQEMSRDAPLNARHFSRVREQLLAGTKSKGRVVRWLMSRRSWDLFFAVFSETHPAGHYFWAFDSNGHRGSVSASLPQLATTLKDVYKAIDREIEKIIVALDSYSSFDKEIRLVVLSGQGMGSNTAKWHLIPELLSRRGFLATKDGRNNSAATNWLAEIRNSIPLEWRRSASRHLPGRLRDRLRVHWANSRIDWTRTRAFHLPTDLLGYIRINLKGREPQGIVEPGSEYDDLCSQVSEALKGLVHPHTGKPIVREIFRSDQTFPGPQRNRLPDLIVTWLDDSEINEGYQKKIGTINGNLPDPRSGNHRPEGFAIFYGTGITKGQVSQGHITDIAPTVLKHFGLKPSSNMDGRPLANVFA